MKVLGIIPARAGSKSIPGKNLRMVGGRPPIAWACLAAGTWTPRRCFYFYYPYGVYTSDTVDIIRARGCAVAFTTKVALAHMRASNLVELSPFDTNDLAKAGGAEPVAWSRGARAHRGVHRLRNVPKP